MFFACNPMQALEARMVADCEEAQVEHDFHQDSVEFPDTRCGICQGEDPEQELKTSGGVQMCSGCLDCTLDVA
jgi:hypothetical protein